MIIPSFGLTATERVLPRLALDFTTAVLDSRVTFTRATSALNPATYTNSSGVITAAANNEPRFDYDPVTLVCKGLLIEESRTNALLNSDTLSTQIVTVTAAVRTLSFYGTGQIVLSGTASATINGSGAYPTRTTYTFTPTAGSLTLTVTGTVQYAQLEIGAFATSYIPTTIAALTRNADVATMTGANFSNWFNASEGCIQIQVNTRNLGGTIYPGWFAIDNNTVSNEVLTMFAYNTELNSLSRKSSANVFVYTKASTVLTTPSVIKAALSYKNSNYIAAYQGASPSQQLSGAVPTGLVQMRIGSYNSRQINGHIQKINYWPQALQPAEVQAFSK